MEHFTKSVKIYSQKVTNLITAKSFPTNSSAYDPPNKSLENLSFNISKRIVSKTEIKLMSCTKSF